MVLQVVATSVLRQGTAAWMPSIRLPYPVVAVPGILELLGTKLQVKIGATRWCSAAAVPPAMIIAIAG